MQRDPWKVDTLTVVYAGEPFPSSVRKSVFLAGPTPRDPEVKSWRPEAIKLLEELGYDGHVFVPEPRSGEWSEDYVGQVEWETTGLNMADIIVFWVPREMKTMPALTTNIEWGLWCDTGKAVFGAPKDAESIRYMRWQCEQLKVPQFDDLRNLLEHVVQDLGEGELRIDGEAKVPLHVWRHPTFQGWYDAQRGAGNRLDDARVLWTFRMGQKRDKVFAWAVHANVWVAKEYRHKSNELVLGRTDIACTILYHKGEDQTNVVLIREFRTPARTQDGFIAELPGGGIDKGVNAFNTALKELDEETGFPLEPERLVYVGQAQLAGTLSAHTASVYAASLTEEEMHWFLERVGETRGLVNEGERTSIVVASYEDLLRGRPEVDWATLGMISACISRS